MGQRPGLGLNRAALAGLLPILLVNDAAMMALHEVYARTVDHLPTVLALHDPRFSLSYDGGVAERVEYLKSAATVIALVVCARRESTRLFWALAAVHLWLLLDNIFRLHERAGYLAGLLLAPDGALTLSSRDFGQPLAFAAIGAGLSLLLWRAWPPRPDLRRLGGLMILSAASIALFAVGVDTLHASVLGPRFGDRFWVLLEDGGETVVLSLNCALAVAFALSPYRAPQQTAPLGRAASAR